MPDAPLYSPAELAWFRENWGETEFLVHVVGPDDVLLYSDERDGFDPGGDHDGTVPHTLETADAAAAAINATYAYTQTHNPSEFDPFFHATVFHYGRPLAAPGDIEAAPAFNADELAWALETWSDTEWVAYVHGMDDCFYRRDGDGPLYTEAEIRKLVADMALLNRRTAVEGLASTPITVLHYGVPFDLDAPADVLHPEVAQQIIRGIIDEHAHEFAARIVENLADWANAGMTDYDVDMLSPKMVNAALEQLRETLATGLITIEWDDDEAAPVPDPNAELHVTFGPSMPGVGKSLAAALMENDAAAEPETTPAVTS